MCRRQTLSKDSGPNTVGISSFHTTALWFKVICPYSFNYNTCFLTGLQQFCELSSVGSFYLLVHVVQNQCLNALFLWFLFFGKLLKICFKKTEKGCHFSQLWRGRLLSMPKVHIEYRSPKGWNIYSYIR